MWDLRERLFGQVQPNIFFDQVSVAELDAFDELLFSPAIEPISRAGFPFQAGNKFLGFSFKEILGFLVVRVDRYGKTEAQSLFDVLDSRCRWAPLAGLSILPALRKTLIAFSSPSLRNLLADGIPTVFANSLSSVAYQ